MEFVSYIDNRPGTEILSQIEAHRGLRGEPHEIERCLYLRPCYELFDEDQTAFYLHFRTLFLEKGETVYCHPGYSWLLLEELIAIVRDGERSLP